MQQPFDLEPQGSVKMVFIFDDLDVITGKPRFKGVNSSANGFDELLGIVHAVDDCARKIGNPVIQKALVNFVVFGGPRFATPSRIQQILQVTTNPFFQLVQDLIP